MSSSVRRWRVIAGVGVLVVLTIVIAVLIPPYFENMRFQRDLDDLVTQTDSPEILRAQVLNRAAQLGLPVQAGNVKVSRSGNGLRVEIVYIIRVDLPLYTVDLHFHPAAGS
jgi:hypothetical protein